MTANTWCKGELAVRPRSRDLAFQNFGLFSHFHFACLYVHINGNGSYYTQIESSEQADQNELSICIVRRLDAELLASKVFTIIILTQSLK